MRVPINKILKPAGMAGCAMVLVLAGCDTMQQSLQSVEKFEREFALPNVILEGSPNQAAIGPVDPYKQTTKTRVGRNVIVAAFRGSGCGRPAPDFETMMRDQIGRGMSVPDGITLYDAGVGNYTSKNCGARTLARAIGVQPHQKGTYALSFSRGKATRTLTVR
jgi:hypothetical protein